MRLELEMPFRIESLNRGMRSVVGSRVTMAKARGQRFAVRRKVKLQRVGARLLVTTKLAGSTRSRLMRTADRLVITLTRIGSGMLDGDNLAAGCKHLRDGIADALEVNDAHPRLRWFYSQERAGRGVYGSRVLFETMTVEQLVERLGDTERARA